LNVSTLDAIFAGDLHLGLSDCEEAIALDKTFSKAPNALRFIFVANYLNCMFVRCSGVLP
jgi:hypothetical protein